MAADDLLSAAPARVPAEPLGRLFLRFLRFGALAWGGPVAQIAMLRHELVDEEKWVSSAHFNRVLALYQILPGPEAHELCVYFGMLSRGRVGGLLAGLGFMLPGFVLIFVLSWLYVSQGLDTRGALAPVFAFVQAAVGALIVRAVHRIGQHVLLDPWLWTIGLLALAAQLLGVYFAITLAGGGILYWLVRRAGKAAGIVFAALCVAGLALWASLLDLALAQFATADRAVETAAGHAGLLQLFLSGLAAGLFTFGGAYTAIPILQHDAVVRGAWMTNAQFLDGLALSGILPAPLIIFGTFVGYLGGGPAGALLMTAGIFLPAFSFTLFAHEPLERLVHHERVRTFLEGVTAAVVGLIAGTAIQLLFQVLTGIATVAVFASSLVVLLRSNSKLAIPLVIAAAAAAGGLAALV